MKLKEQAVSSSTSTDLELQRKYHDKYQRLRRRCRLLILENAALAACLDEVAQKTRDIANENKSLCQKVDRLPASNSAQGKSVKERNGR